MRRAHGRAIAATAVLVAFAGAAQAQEQTDWIDQRTEVRAEVTTAATAETLFNPGGKVIAADAINSRLRPRSELTLRLPAEIGFKSIVAFQLVNAPGDRPQLDGTLIEAYLRRPIGRAELRGDAQLCMDERLRLRSGRTARSLATLRTPQERLGLLEGRDLVHWTSSRRTHLHGRVRPGEVGSGQCGHQGSCWPFDTHTVVPDGTCR